MGTSVGDPEAQHPPAHEVGSEPHALPGDADFGRAVLQHVAEGLCVCHEIAEFPFVRFTVWNEAMVRITGYGMEAINRLGWYQTLYVDSGVRARAIERMQRMRQGDDLHGEEWEITRADGARRQIRISTSILSYRGAVHVLAVILDVTDRKREEERRNELEAQLRQAQKMETVGHLAGGIAHDFNNILAAVALNLGMIRDHVSTHPHLRELVDDTDQQAQRAAALVRQLLLFARREVMTVRCLDLEALLDRLLRLLRRLIGADIELARAGGTSPAWIEGDSGMLEQVVTNLVLNARDALPRGGRISLRTETVELAPAEAARNPEARPGRFVRLTVTDDGVGMDAATLRRVFEPFFTTKEVGQGTGLGLSTAYGIVRQHGGWLEAESVPGRGSSFFVYLPAASEQARGGGGAAAEAPATSRDLGTILVVDDEPAVAQAVVRILERRGYRTLVAKDGPAALEASAGEPGPIDLLVTDLVMPGGVGGEELASRLKDARPGMAVILMSGYRPDRAARGDLGPDGAVFLAKPFGPQVLLDSVQRCLGRAGSRES